MKFTKLNYLLFLLFLMFVYLLGIEITVNYINYFFSLFFKYIVYYLIISLIDIVCLILYYIVGLYILHVYVKKRELGEKIYISKVLPDFIIKKLEDLKLFSEKDVLIREIKRLYYGQIVICSIAVIIICFGIYSTI